MSNFQPIAQDGWKIHHWFIDDGEVYYHSAPVAGWIDDQPAWYQNPRYPILLTPLDFPIAPDEVTYIQGPGDEHPEVVLEAGRLQVSRPVARRVQVYTRDTEEVELS